MKKCTKCLQEKKLDQFAKLKHGSLGRKSWCKACDAEYRAGRKQIIRAYNQKYHAAHRQQIREWHAKYYQEHQEDIKARVKKYQQDNPQVYLDARVRRRGFLLQFTPLSKQDWLQIMQLTDWTCAYCGVKLNQKSRTIDHVIPLSKGGHHIVENLVPACRSCNSAKGARIQGNSQ